MKRKMGLNPIELALSKRGIGVSSWLTLMSAEKGFHQKIWINKEIPVMSKLHTQFGFLCFSNP